MKRFLPLTGIGQTNKRSRNCLTWLAALILFGLQAAPVLAQVNVPNVVGQPSAAAADLILEAATLDLGTATTVDSAAPAGEVLSQLPTAGSSVPAGTLVNITVSSGPVNVPNVVGDLQATAVTSITGAGLVVGTVTTVDSALPATQVLSQNPTAGSSVAPNTAVDLSVSSGPVSVPNVVNQPQATAEGNITGAGLTVGTVTTANDPVIVAGNVISQNPTGGTPVAPNTSVDLVVSLGPAPVNVPNVVGQPTAASADAILEGVGLDLGTATTVDSAQPIGQVLSQNPTAGTSVLPGTLVDVTVSSGPVLVPNVVNQPQATAEGNITGAGLTVGTVTTANDPVIVAGNVISQNPTANTPVAPSTSVDLLVSLGPANNPPVFTSAPVTDASEETLYTYNVTATDDDAGDTLTLAAPTLPMWLTFTGGMGMGTAAATLTGTPTASEIGDHNVTLTVTDGIIPTPVQQNFTITVADVNFPPVLDSPITPDPQNATEGTPFAFDVSGFFSDPDPGDVLTFSAAGLPPNLIIAPLTGIIAGTPLQPDVDGAPYNVVVTASDAEFQVSDAGFTLNVLNVENSPTLLSPIPDQNATENATFSLDTSAFFNDVDNHALTFSATGLPPSGNLTLNSVSGELSGSPSDADVLGAPYTVLVTATDPTARSVSDTPPGFVLSITDVNNPPIENPDPNGLPSAAPNADELIPYSFDLSGFFSDADGDTLTYVVGGLPPSGNLTLNANTGVISGTPQEVDTSDTPITLTVTVTDIPRAGLSPASVGPLPFSLTISRLDRVDISLSVSATPDPAPVNDSVTWNYTITNNNPVLTVPQVDLVADFVGVPFTFTDTGACTVVAQTLNCTAGPIPPDSNTVVSIVGNATQPGDVFMSATASTPNTGDPATTLIDSNPLNNTAEAALNVGQSFSTGPGQSVIATGAQSLAAGDVNGDGFTDLTVGTAAGSSTEIYLSVPRTPVDPPDPLTDVFRRLSDTPIELGDVANSSQDLMLIDIDGDMDLDLVAANGVPGAPEANTVFLNDVVDGTPTFTSNGSPLGNQTSFGLAAADFNGDLMPDLAFANGSPNELFINQGGGTFAAGQTLGDADSRAVVIADFDGDGQLDLLFANADGPSVPYRGLGDGTFVAQSGIPVGPVVSVRSDDFSGDGLPDLVFGRATSTFPALPSNPVYFNTSTPGTISFSPFGSPLGASPTTKLISGDINLDGIVDVVALNLTSTHQLFVGIGNGSFNLNPEQFSAAGIRGAALGDLNNDGRVDLAVGGVSGIDIFFNDGNGNLGAGDVTPPVITLTGAAMIPVEVEAEYIDAGATASDNIDGDISIRVVTDNPVDTAIVGTYTVTYNVFDSSGNAAMPVTRSVQVGAREGTGGGGGGSTGGGFLGLLTLVLFLRRNRRG